MKVKVKFHKATSPAFNQGEIWVSATGAKVVVISVRKYVGATGDHSSDYGVTYYTDPINNLELTYEEDCWNFQVRYTHIADTFLG